MISSKFYKSLYFDKGTSLLQRNFNNFHNENEMIDKWKGSHGRDIM